MGTPAALHLVMEPLLAHSLSGQDAARLRGLSRGLQASVDQYNQQRLATGKLQSTELDKAVRKIVHLVQERCAGSDQLITHWQALPRGGYYQPPQFRLYAAALFGLITILNSNQCVTEPPSVWKLVAASPQAQQTLRRLCQRCNKLREDLDLVLDSPGVQAALVAVGKRFRPDSAHSPDEYFEFGNFYVALQVLSDVRGDAELDALIRGTALQPLTKLMEHFEHELLPEITAYILDHILMTAMGGELYVDYDTTCTNASCTSPGGGVHTFTLFDKDILTRLRVLADDNHTLLPRLWSFLTDDPPSLFGPEQWATIMATADLIRPVGHVMSRALTHSLRLGVERYQRAERPFRAAGYKFRIELPLFIEIPHAMLATTAAAERHVRRQFNQAWKMDT